MKRSMMFIKEKAGEVITYFRSKKGLSEVVQVVVIIGVVALVAAKVLPPLATSLDKKSVETSKKLDALDKVYT